MKNPPNTGLFRLIWPPGESGHRQTKEGYPALMVIVEHIRFFWVAVRTKNAQSSKWFAAGYICTLQQAPTSSIPPKTFYFWNRVPFHFFGLKKPKSGPKSTLFVFQKLNHFQWSASRGFWTKIWEVLFLYFLYFLFWNLLKLLIFLKKRIWFPLELLL